VKTCRVCRTEKPLSEFYKWKQGETGYRPDCKQCYNAKAREYWKGDPKRQDRLLTRHNWHLLDKYGLTAEQWQQMVDAQGGRCFLCGRTPEEAGGRSGPLGVTLHVDHDHRCCSGPRSCGKCIRGLLCAPCNRMVGWIERIGKEKIAAYVE
jgi:hypothetical protein